MLVELTLQIFDRPVSNNRLFKQPWLHPLNYCKTCCLDLLMSSLVYDQPHSRFFWNVSVIQRLFCYSRENPNTLPVNFNITHSKNLTPLYIHISCMSTKSAAQILSSGKMSILRLIKFLVTGLCKTISFSTSVSSCVSRYFINKFVAWCRSTLISTIFMAYEQLQMLCHTTLCQSCFSG